MSVSFRFIEKLHRKNKGGERSKKTFDVDLPPPQAHVCVPLTLTCMYTAHPAQNTHTTQHIQNKPRFHHWH